MTFTIRIEKLVFSVALVGVMMGTALAGPPDWEWIVQVGSNGTDEVFDAALLSLDELGRERWRDQVGTNQTDGVAGLGSGANGNTVAAGFTNGDLYDDSAGGTDGWVAGWDSGGTNQWGRQIGTPGNDEAFDAAANGEGGICYTGLSDGNYGGPNQGSFDIIGGCLDAEGNEVWRGQWGTSAPDSCEAICSHPGGNVVMGGGSAGPFDGNSNGGFDCVLLSLDESGRERWRDQVGTNLTDGVLGIDCDDTCCGDHVAAGFTNGDLFGESAGGTDGWVAGWDSGGTNLWGKQVGTSGTDIFGDAVILPPNTGIVTGSTTGSLGGPNQGGPDVFVGSYNSDGSTNWTNQFGTFTTDQGSRIILDTNGKIYITGRTFGSLFDQNQGSADAFVVKLSPTTGEIEWGRQLGSNQADIPHALASDGMRGILIAGETNGDLGGKNQGGADGFIAHYDGDGKLLSVRQFGTTGSDKIYGIVTDNIEGIGGNLLVAGSTTGSLYGPNAGGADVFLAMFPIIPCPWDLDSNGSVGIGDLLLLLGNWGNPYGIGDLLAMLANWGPCP